MKRPNLQINKKYTVLLIVPAIMIAGFFILDGSRSNGNANVERQLKPGDITVVSRISILPEGDNNRNGLIDGGDAFNISFILENKSTASGLQLNLETGIEKKFVYNIRNQKNLSGQKLENGKFIIQNIPVSANQTQTISFDANAVFSDSNYEISIKPVLYDSQDSVIDKGKVITNRVLANKRDEIPTNVVVEKEQ